jgi:hypothetical protein
MRQTERKTYRTEQEKEKKGSKMNETDSTMTVTDLGKPETESTMPKTKRKIYTLYNIENVLDRADLFVAGWKSDTDIQNATAVFNITEERIGKVEASIAAARTSITATQQGRASYRRLAAETGAAHEIARTAAADLSTVARLELTEAERAAMGLVKGGAPLAIAAFLLYADRLFDGALAASSEIKAKLADAGYTQARLESERAKIDNLRRLHAATMSAKGTAQDLTPTQKTTLDALDSEVMKLRAYARRALRERPQLLEKIGVKA